jgi:soluble lytic murein transglycosylase-like protein
MIRSSLAEWDLPPEFLFIAYRESGFDNRAVGPPTRIGVFAKGMWQLIPDTAQNYGLEVGPDKDKRVFDPSDQRHDEIRSTKAAAHFLADLYNTKAKASGLLVMASYNYGPHRITKNLDKLANDPRIRSFWNFYRQGWLPPETQEYVFNIMAAALICRHPDLFGYDLGTTSPLQ